MTEAGLTHRRHIFAARMLLIVCALLACYWIGTHVFHIKARRSFTISAVSERVVVTVAGHDGTALRLPAGLRVARLAEPLSQSSLLHLPEHAMLDVARRDLGDVRLRVRTAEGHATLTRGDGETVDLDSDATMLLPAEATPPIGLVLPFRGAVFLGPEVREAVEYLLLSGTVTALEKPLIGDRRAVLNAVLDPGDDVRWLSEVNSFSTAPADLAQQAAGFISVGEGPAVRVVAHVVAKQLTVQRFGAEAYDIKPSALESSAKDPVLTDVLVPLLALLSAAFVLHDSSVKIWENCTEPPRSRPRRH